MRLEQSILQWILIARMVGSMWDLWTILKLTCVGEDFDLCNQVVDA